MNRIVTTFGSILVMFGVGLLVYVGITYAGTTHGPRTASWSAAQQKQGTQIASRLSGHQRVAVPSRAAVKGAPIAGQSATRMIIPRINLDAPVVQTRPVGGVWEVADWAVGHLSTTPNPGSPGNGAYAAHDDIKGEIFKRLSELSPGSVILLYTPQSVFRYTVVRQLTVDPSNVSVLSPTKQSTITLVSCTPYWVDTQRLIVQAVLTSSARR